MAALSVEVMLEVGIMAFYLPMMPAIASLLVSGIDCGFSALLMWAYFLYAVNYAARVDVLFGVLHASASIVGCLNIGTLCNPSPSEAQATLAAGLRDLKMLVKSD